MTSSSSIDGNAGTRRISIRRDKLRLVLRFRARLPEIDEVRNALTAYAASGSQQEHGCSKEPAR